MEVNLKSSVQNLKGEIKAGANSLIGKLNVGIKEIYPELEKLEVTPSLEEQNIKPQMYGFSEVTVKPIEGDNLEIIPSLEKQEFNGLYDEVTVKPIETEDLVINPTAEQQSFSGVFQNVIVEAVDITVSPNYNNALNLSNEIIGN